MPRALVSAGALLLLLSHSPANAQAPTAEARGLFEAGIAAYDAGRYVDALEHFARCYDLTGEPALLYNMARAAEEAGRLEEALAHYGAYRARAPAADGDDVDARVEALRLALARATPPPRPNETPPERVDEPEPSAVVARAAGVRASETRDPSPAPWVVVAVGAVAALAGGALLGPWAAASDAVTGAEAVDWSSVRSDYDAATAYSTAAALLLSIGGAALAAGLVWAAVEETRGPDLALGIGPAGAHLRVRF